MKLTEVEGFGLTETETVYDLTESGARGPIGETGPAGPGLPSGGTVGQKISKVDGTDYNTEWIDDGDYITKYWNRTTDIIIDWANAKRVIIDLQAIINITFINWHAKERTTDGSLLLINADIYPPTWSEFNQGTSNVSPAAGFVTFLELSTNEGGDIYNMWQVSNDQLCVLGVDFISNGGFDDATDWTAASGVSISGGKATWAGTTAFANLDQITDPLPVLGARYLIKFDLSGITAGSLRVRYGSADNQHILTANGSYSLMLDGYDSITVLRFQSADALFDGSIDNVSLQRLY